MIHTYIHTLRALPKPPCRQKLPKQHESAPRGAPMIARCIVIGFQASGMGSFYMRVDFGMRECITLVYMVVSERSNKIIR
jgi:hypothetical protein